MVEFERPTQSKLAKAVIQVLDEKRDPIPERDIPVLFNPTEYSINTSANYAEQSLLGLSTPITQFVSGAAETLSMELLFDTYEKGPNADVRDDTDELDGLVTVKGDRHAPPILRVKWATLYFDCVLESVDKQFTLFHPSGKPARARVSVTFKKHLPPRWETKFEKRESADRTKVLRPTQSDTLPLIAAKEYDDPGRWRVIAEANEIDNPRMIQTGRELVLPPLEE